MLKLLRRRRANADAGLTLVEMVAALGVLTIVFVAAGAGFIAAITSQRNAESTDKAVQLASSEIEKVRNVAWNALGFYEDTATPGKVCDDRTTANDTQPKNAEYRKNKVGTDWVVTIGKEACATLPPNAILPVQASKNVNGIDFTVYTRITWDITASAVTDPNTAYGSKRVEVTAEWTAPGGKAESYTAEWTRSPSAAEAIPEGLNAGDTGDRCVFQGAAESFCRINITEGQVLSAPTGTTYKVAEPIRIAVQMRKPATAMSAIVDGTTRALTTTDEGMNWTLIIPKDDTTLTPGNKDVILRGTVYTNTVEKTVPVAWRAPLAVQTTIDAIKPVVDMNKQPSDRSAPTGSEPQLDWLCVKPDGTVQYKHAVLFNVVGVDEMDGMAPPVISWTDATGQADVTMSPTSGKYVGARNTAPGTVNTVRYAHLWDPATKFDLAAGKTTITISAQRPGDGAIVNTSYDLPLRSAADASCQNASAEPGGAYAPVGALESATKNAGPRSVQVKGWAVDPDNLSEQVRVYVEVDGAQVVSTIANKLQATETYPGAGNLHGYDVAVTVPVTSANPNICVYAVDDHAARPDVQIGCKVVSLPTGSPNGKLESVEVDRPGYLRVKGWALDPDTEQPISVQILVNGGTQTVIANVARADIGAANPGYGIAHGFDAVVPAMTSDANRQVCATALNVGGGSNKALNCLNIMDSGSVYQPITPRRLGGLQPIAAGGSIRVTIPTVPTGATAVALNVTAVNAAGSTWIAVCPGGTSTFGCAGGGYSTINVIPGYAEPNETFVKLGGLVNREVVIYSHSANVDVIVDLHGYFVDVKSAGSNGSVYKSLVGPDRHTVTGLSAATPQTLTLRGVPAGATAVAVNLTGYGATAVSHTSVCPGGTAASTCIAKSDLNPRNADAFANFVVVKLGGANKDQLLLTHSSGSITMLVDVQGWFIDAALSPASAAGGSTYLPQVPKRQFSGPVIGPGAMITQTLTSVPKGATHVALHLIVTGITGNTFVSACAGSTPIGACAATSDINARPGDNFENLTLIPLGGPNKDQVNIYNSQGNTTVHGDVLGFMVNPNASMPTGNPYGDVNNVTSPKPGYLYVRGWAIDPDSYDPIDVHMYVNGQGYNLGPANVNRPDVATVYPAYGPDHGFEKTIKVHTGGTLDVCFYAINVGPGNLNPLIECTQITTPTGAAYGNWENFENNEAGTVRVKGWAIDPDTYDPIDIHVYVNGKGYNIGPANVNRPDVGGIYPAYGPTHGFDKVVQAPPGSTVEVCVWMINVGTGATNNNLGCRTMFVMGYDAGAEREFAGRQGPTPGQPQTPLVVFGKHGDQALACDWDGDGKDTPGVFRNGWWFIKNTMKPGPADLSFAYGWGGTKAVCGDWNGDGKDSIGVWDPATGNWWMKNTAGPGSADYPVFNYGDNRATPVVGDWDGNGTDTIGVYWGNDGGYWDLRNSISGGGPEIHAQYGANGDIPVVGDWDSNGKDTMGVVNPASKHWYLINNVIGGAPNYTVQYGAGADQVIPANWDGITGDGVGVYRYAQVPSLAQIGSGWNNLDLITYVGDWDGDGKGDLVARKYSTGELLLYATTGTGSWKPGTGNVIGNGWGIMTELLGPGDWDGDGRTDILAVTTAGDLLLYRGNGAGAFTDEARRNLGTGWNTVGARLGAGDFNGDNRPDILARDNATGDLLFYPSDAAGNIVSRNTIGKGWHVLSIGQPLKNFENLGTGLMFREAGNSNMRFYPYDGAGGFKPMSMWAASGFASMIDMHGIGDWNGDGRTDFVVQDGGGYLYVYLGRNW